MNPNTGQENPKRSHLLAVANQPPIHIDITTLQLVLIQAIDR
jgi:hypothetical protein